MSEPAQVPPSGDQYQISGGGYRAVVTESGAALRVLEHRDVPLVDGFGPDEMSSGGRGQLLMPWPNRIAHGRYRFEGRDQQLPISEPSRGNASHGLARWASFAVEEHTAHSVSLGWRLMAQTGYPWTLDLHVLYDLSADGLTVTQTATNLADAPAPYACGAHPYLALSGALDDWELTLPAGARSVVDPDTLVPVGREPVDGTDFDFRIRRPIRRTVFNDAFTDLTRDELGRAVVELATAERTLVLWGDRRVGWFQVYSGDDAPTRPRTSLAVEPMTAQANAFATGEDLLVLAPAGESGDEVSVSWGIRVT